MINSVMLRRIHRIIGPILILPLLLTLVTGTLYQIAILTENAADYFWLVEWHRGTFGRLDLRAIYPFLNAAGLLMIVITGSSLWIQMRSHRHSG